MKAHLPIASAIVLGVTSAVVAWALADSGAPPVRPCRKGPAAATTMPATPVAATPRPDHPAAPAAPDRIRWLAFGGGADPPSNQISIEQNLLLASRSLAERGDGVLLFAGGPGASWVQQLHRPQGPTPLRVRLGEIFAPRPDRGTAYRQSELPSHGAATLTDVLGHLDRALRQPDDGSLLLAVAAHGDPGTDAADTAVVLWGGQVLTVRELTRRLDRSPHRRPIRLVMSSCFSGGFAEVVFADADPTKGPAPGERCGLFATTWDREASGCDPDPDRRMQEGYSLYFWNALRGAGREGRAAERGRMDIDGDGRISLLEAHTRVRIASRSISLPTTTSERWLRSVAPQAGPQKPMELPEEDAVIAELGRKLGIHDHAAANRQRGRLERQIDLALTTLEQLELRRDDALLALQMSLLERWPVIDDPFHGDFPGMLDHHREAIEAALRTEPPARAYRATQAEVDRLAAAIAKQQVELALTERVIRAYETRTLAARLHAAGGAALERYRAILACERTVLAAD